LECFLVILLNTQYYLVCLFVLYTFQSSYVALLYSAGA
jgi:hypothetical protein